MEVVGDPMPGDEALDALGIGIAFLQNRLHRCDFGIEGRIVDALDLRMQLVEDALWWYPVQAHSAAAREAVTLCLVPTGSHRASRHPRDPARPGVGAQTRCEANVTSDRRCAFFHYRR